MFVRYGFAYSNTPSIKCLLCESLGLELSFQCQCWSQVSGLHLPGKDTEVLRCSTCVWTHEAREAENSGCCQLPLRPQPGPLSRFLSAASGPSSVSMKAEKMRLDSRRCLQKRPSGRDVKVPQGLPAKPCPLLSPAPIPGPQNSASGDPALPAC